jgi:predicted ATPase
VARKHRSTPGPYLQYLELLRDRIPDPTCYPYNLPAFQGLTQLAFHPKVTFLVGENGSGKSTLLEALAIQCDLNPEGGSRNFNFATRASHSLLGDSIRLVKSLATPHDCFFLRAESFYNVATEVERLGPQMLGSYGGKSLHEQSHGESFFALFENRFGDNGLYLMDEPEAALSASRQLQFLRLLHNFVLRGGQFVIATHSPIIMAYPDARIYFLDSQGLRDVAYTEIEHFSVTKSFLNNPQRSLAVLFSDDPEPD